MFKFVVVLLAIAASIFFLPKLVKSFVQAEGYRAKIATVATWGLISGAAGIILFNVINSNF